MTCCRCGREAPRCRRVGNRILSRLTYRSHDPNQGAIRDLPAGLVLYYVVNTVLSMAQQWNINRRIRTV